MSKAFTHFFPPVVYKVGDLLRGHPDERPTPLERPLDNVNLNINELISTSDWRPALLKGHFCSAKGVALQEGFHCMRWNRCIPVAMAMWWSRGSSRGWTGPCAAASPRRCTRGWHP